MLDEIRRWQRLARAAEAAELADPLGYTSDPACAEAFAACPAWFRTVQALYGTVANSVAWLSADYRRAAREITQGYEDEAYSRAREEMTSVIAYRLTRSGLDGREAAEIGREVTADLVISHPDILQRVADPGGSRWWYRRADGLHLDAMARVRWYPEGDEYGNDVLVLRVPFGGALYVVTNLRRSKIMRPDIDGPQ